MSTRTRLLAGLATVALAAACSSCSRTAHHGATAGTTTTAPATTTTTLVGPTVLRTGSAPRRLLRLALTRGTTSTVAITSDVLVTQATPGGDQIVNPPPVTQTIRYTVGRVGTDGAAVSFVVTGAVVAPTGTDLSPAEVAQLTAALAPIVGTRGRGHLSPLGRFSAVHFDLAPHVDADTRNQVSELPGRIDALAPVLPTPAMGVGGSWTTTGESDVGGFQADVATTYVVTAIAGDQVTYRSTTRVSAGGQRVPGTALGSLPGTSAELLSSTITGTGAGTLVLDRPVSPSSALLAGRQVVELASAKVAEQRLTQQVRLVTRVRPVP